jgi:hypothetical protein
MNKNHRLALSIVIIFFVLFMLIGVLLEDDSVDDPNILVLNESSEDFVGENYETVIANLETIGFTNIKTEILDDLILGWLTSDGEVEQVTINGKTDFDKNTKFTKDSEVIITYHTFPSNSTDAVVNQPTKNTDSEANQPSKSAEIVVNYPQENALRAAVVAFTNRHADDVFTADGNHYDLSKFHSYADVSGFLLIVEYEGVWTAKNENTWHVEGLSLKLNNYNTEITASLDVSYVDNNYFVSNLSGKAPSYDDISVYENESEFSMFFTVPTKLIEDDREPGKELEEYIAKRAFENYGDYLYPYGFEVHWFTGLEIHEQSYDGSWYFRVSVTITNQFGASKKTVAEAYVNNTTETVENFRLD